jgi:serine/threonine-protein kinase
MAPERAEASTPPDARQDLFSVGVVLFEMLAGHPPFVGESPVAVAAAHVHNPPPDVAVLVPGVPGPVAAACMRALSKDPTARPRSAGEFAAMLRDGSVATSPLEPAALAGEPRTEVLPPPVPVVDGGTAPTEVMPPAGGPAAPPERRRGRAATVWALIGVLVVLLLVAVVLAGIRKPASTPRPSPATSTTAVPAVVGLRLADATQKIVAAGLTVGRVDRVAGPAGIVRAVHPSAGTSLAVGAPVTLDVGSGPTPKPPHKRKRGRHGHGGGD